jgi:translation initiation factor IF-3
MDLVMMAENDPPVCKIMDYGKHIFEPRSRKLLSEKAKRIQIKEMKFRPGTDEGDYQVKLRNLVRFLENGDKAKVTLRYRGREMAHQEIGMELLKRVEADLSELGSCRAVSENGRPTVDHGYRTQETGLVARECPKSDKLTTAEKW